MYEEDRQTALAMYNQLFDEVDDEQGLLQLLVSPTRQAVVIARSYNAKERKLQVHAQSREESDTASDGAAPEFMGVIESIREEALSRQAPKTAEVSADQFSMFEDDFFAPTPETPAAPAEAEPEAPAEEAAAPVAEAPAVEVEAEAEAPAETAEPAADEPVDEVDAFIADFAIPADRQEFAPDAGEQTAPAEPAEPAQPEAAEAAESDEDDSAPIAIEEENVEEYDDEYDDEYYDDEEYEPVRKPRVFLLILYILLAVPVGLLGILLLIVPTLLFLVLAGLIITGGVMAVTSAFSSGIAVFADIMVIIGMAFILLALGLLALWIAVWLVGGVMVGLVRGLIHLGGKWCYKEVEA